MALITLEINDPEKESLIKKLVKQLGIKIIQKESEDQKDAFRDKLEELANQIGEGSFGDASAYQREVRKDRKLPGR